MKNLSVQTLESLDLKEIILESLIRSMSYNEYRALVNDLAKNGSTTGRDKSEAMVEFTKLNQKRMKRWDKTLKISDDALQLIKPYNKKTTWLLITESWCGDAAHIVPAINKVAEQNDKIDLKLVLRDDNDNLINQFLTNGGKSIPKLIVLNENFNVIDTFGPRPNFATKLVDEYKAEYGTLKPEFKEELQRWYNKDKGQSTIDDLVALLK